VPASGPTISSGRRGYLRYQYGEHFWIPEVLADFSKGMVRDTARIAIPDGSVYDSADYLLDQPGVARKRGGTSYAGPALTGSTFVPVVKHVPFLTGSPGTAAPQLLAIGDNTHLYKITAGAATDIGVAAQANIWIPIALSPGSVYAICVEWGATSQKYDGATISTLAGGLGLTSVVSYKSRLVGIVNTQTNRLLFSPTPDVNAAWDVNSYIDCDNTLVGLAALNNVLLLFSPQATERIIGATPPPNSDMDRAPLSSVGCTDARSIVTESPYVYFANPQGVFMTNGSTPVSLTMEGGISTYWRSLFSGYVQAWPIPTNATWTIAAGFWRGFLFISVLNASRALQACLMCQVRTRAWWRLTNVNAMSWTTSVDGTELWYGDAATNRVVAMSGIFNPSAANKLDANGSAVAPSIEFRPVGQGTGTKAYAWGHLNFDMRDAAADNPTMAVTVKTGIEADTSYTPPESPLQESSTLTRPRFQINRNAQAATVALAQTGPSAKTELYALEVQQRQQSLVGEGVT
jgi:hypothetical protein